MPSTTATATAERSVGRFTYSAGSISGPADYMRAQGFARLEKIHAGQDTIVSFGLARDPAADLITLILVSLQTDFAGWQGLQSFRR